MGTFQRRDIKCRSDDGMRFSDTKFSLTKQVTMSVHGAVNMVAILTGCI